MAQIARKTKAPAAKSDTQIEAIVIKALKQTAFQVYLMGDSPLIVHAWSQKAIMEMLSKHMQLPKQAREAKNPYDHFLRSIYRLEDKAYGFPVTAAKEAMATAILDVGGKKAQVYRNVVVTGRRGFQIGAFADIKTPYELAELFSPNAPQMREDMVRLSDASRTPDVRYRAEFFPWALRFNVAYIPEFVSAESLHNLLYHAGFRVGLGEWRQEKGGSNGLFHVADAVEVKSIERWIKAGQREPMPIDTTAWLRKLAEEAKQTDVVVPKHKRGNGKDEAVSA